ncbi:MAG: cysteine peptidase family C39 domain-containing protein [Oscillibacter sp.]|nr:cysteine peptidase family C39 domain-containing protein [Oscillibacter sp.]
MNYNAIPEFLYLFLRKIKIKTNFLQIRELYSQHPLPHSCRALSDILDKLRVEHIVCALSFEQLFKIEGPFIVITANKEFPFSMVEQLNKINKTIELRTVGGKKITLSFEQFCAIWDGKVLIAEKNENTPEVVYGIKPFLWFIERKSLYFLVSITICFLVLNIMQFPGLEKLRYWVKGIGGIFSMFIVIKTIYDQNLMQRICHQGNHFDCNEVLNASGAKLLGWVSLGELSLAYFLSSLLWGFFITESPVPVFLLLDSLALLFVVYSLIWQIFHHRWCMLCLIIDLILISDFVFEIIVWDISPKNFSFYYFDIFNYSLLFCLCLLGIRQIVRTVEQNQKRSQIEFKHELLLKYPDIFWNLLAQQPQIKIDSNTIPTINNYLDTEHVITIIINPSCSKCVQVPHIISALKKYRINLVFFINEQDTKAYEAALFIISSGIVNKWEETTHIIEQWYATHNLPANQFIHPCAQDYLKAQIDYCQKIRIEGTPTLLVDNRLIPEIYDMNELYIIL